MMEDNLSYEEAEERVKSLNPSSKLVFYILEKQGSEMLKTELEEETLLESSTITEAFKRLENENIGYKRNNPMAQRKPVWA